MEIDQKQPLDDPWVVLVESVKGFDVPMGVRVKRWLKAGLRSYGLRCVEIRTARPNEIEQVEPIMDVQQPPKT